MDHNERNGAYFYKKELLRTVFMVYFLGATKIFLQTKNVVLLLSSHFRDEYKSILSIPIHYMVHQLINRK